MQFSKLAVLLPLLASSIFASPVVPGKTLSPDEDYELTIKFKRDVNLNELPESVTSKLEALGLDGSKGTFFVNGEQIAHGKRDLSNINDALHKTAGAADEAYELTIKW